jgi:tetratricopeptide (TPR) repeat protein
MGYSLGVLATPDALQERALKLLATKKLFNLPIRLASRSLQISHKETPIFSEVISMKFRLALFLTLLLTFSAISHGAIKLPNQAIAGETHHHHPEAKAEQSAPLFDNLGNHHHPISTQNPLAQRYFNQGLILSYGFNHAEAARSFQQAAKLDPNCAMCYWGLAYVQGPNINAPMDDLAIPTAWQAIQQAIALSKNATNREKAYIWALAKRYSPKPIADRKPFDLAYAKAMRQVTRQFPDDLDAATLFAEALMDTTPWDYWDENGNPKAEGIEIMRTLEDVLKRHPNHPGANHLYIHAVEKERPELGIPSADRLMTLVPGSGHLVHMASHIYIRVGRYHDAVLSNQMGIEADKAYNVNCHAQGIYPLAYMPHNQHFLWFAALMTGQSDIAIDAAKHTAKVDEKLMRQPEMAGSLQHYYTIPMYTLARFGQWDEILAMPAPAVDLKYPNGVRHYVRGLAFLAKGQLKPATQELQQLKTIATDPALQEVKIWGFNSTSNVLNIATNVLAGRVAAQQGNYSGAINYLQQAVRIEDSLIYTEPADWYHPARQSLGMALLQAGKAAEAEQTYRKDLEIYPENGWSLYGLAQSLKAQGKTEESQIMQARFEKAWEFADVQPTL